jgi:hypothetical protein
MINHITVYSVGLTVQRKLLNVVSNGSPGIIKIRSKCNYENNNFKKCLLSFLSEVMSL